jgi:endoglycosylceramidase
VGYDLINEPWPGSSWRRCVLPGGCRAFDSRHLQRMQEHVAAGVRAMDRTTPIWWEGSTLTAFGMRNEVGAERPFSVAGGNTVLSYHSYCMLGGSLPFLTQGQDPTCMSVHRRTFRNAQRAAARNGSTPVITEFGASDELVDVARITSLADANMQSWFYWHYGSWQDPTGAPHVQGLFIDDADRPGSLKQAKADALVRTYPQAVAGIPLQFRFEANRLDRRFTMTYVPDLRIAQETVVSVPARHYPDGYDVYVTGPARVTSAADAPLLTLASSGARGAVRVVVLRHGAPLA